MEWLDHLNEAVTYIEKQLAGEIDYDRVAQLACCSSYHFQRMFSYIAGVPLGEYIRRRRMSLAAVELQNGGKVLDTALRYGYESPTAFNRAFQGVHGVTPSAARGEGVTLRAYPRLSFKLTVKGAEEMEYRIVKKDAFRIVGRKESLSKDVEECFQMVPQMWQRAAQEGVLPRIIPLMEGEPTGVLGVSACGGDEWEYYIAVATEKEAPVGLSEYTVPAGTWAVFPGTGAMPRAIQELEKRVVTEWLPSSGYEYADRPDMEVYLEPDPAKARFEVWVPVVKK